MHVNFKKLRPDATIPSFGHGDSSNAGIDFYACLPEHCDTVIMPNNGANIPTGVAWEPDTNIDGYEMYIGWKPAMIIKGRSGLAINSGIEECNAGVIDSGYRGEIILRLYNHGTDAFTIHTGDRIAQGIVVLLPYIEVKEVSVLSDSIRGASGFGSSGR
jgi:deoxyuridine 5''-triphosphate nucleotidohydrolase (dut)